LRLPPTTILTISSPIFMNANLSNTRSTYAMAGALPHATYTFESSHSAPNDNILARSDSSSTNTTNTYLPSSSDPSATSSTSTHTLTDNEAYEDIDIIEISYTSNHINEEDNISIASEESHITFITVINDNAEMQNFNDSTTNDLVHNTDRYRTYQNNLNLLNIISGYDELYMGDVKECFVCHHDIIAGENMGRQGWQCDNIHCRVPRIYHLFINPNRAQPTRVAGYEKKNNNEAL